MSLLSSNEPYFRIHDSGNGGNVGLYTGALVVSAMTALAASMSSKKQSDNQNKG